MNKTGRAVSKSHHFQLGNSRNANNRNTRISRDVRKVGTAEQVKEWDYWDQCSGSMIFLCGNGSGSMPVTNGSGFGSCYFRHWPSRWQQKTNFFNEVFLLITFWRYIHIGKQLLLSNDRNRVRSFRPLTGWGQPWKTPAQICLKISARTAEWNHCQPASFLIGQYL